MAQEFKLVSESLSEYRGHSNSNESSHYDNLDEGFKEEWNKATDAFRKLDKLIPKFEKIEDQGDKEDRVDSTFKRVFSHVFASPHLGQVKSVAKKTSVEDKIGILKKAAEDEKPGTLRIKNGELVYVPWEKAKKHIKSDFAQGGTGGKTSSGGV